MSPRRQLKDPVRPGWLRPALVAGALATALAVSLGLSGCGSLATTTTTPAPTSSTSTSGATGAIAPATTSTTQMSESAVTAYAALYSTLDATLNSAKPTSTRKDPRVLIHLRSEPSFSRPTATGGPLSCSPVL